MRRRGRHASAGRKPRTPRFRRVRELRRPPPGRRSARVDGTRFREIAAKNPGCDADFAGFGRLGEPPSPRASAKPQVASFGDRCRVRSRRRECITSPIFCSYLPFCSEKGRRFAPPAPFSRNAAPSEAQPCWRRSKTGAAARTASRPDRHRSPPGTAIRSASQPVLSRRSFPEPHPDRLTLLGRERRQAPLWPATLCTTNRRNRMRPGADTRPDPRASRRLKRFSRRSAAVRMRPHAPPGGATIPQATCRHAASARGSGVRDMRPTRAGAGFVAGVRRAPAAQTKTPAARMRIAHERRASQRTLEID